MKQTGSTFATYAKDHLMMNSSSKKLLKKRVMGLYGSVYGDAIVESGGSSLFTYLFGGNMTVAKLAIYLVASLMLGTGVYAGVAPDSFAKTSASVKAGVAAAIDTTLETVGIKTRHETDTHADIEIGSGNDEETATTTVGGLLDRLLGSDTNTQTEREAEANAQGSIEAAVINSIDTDVETNIEADARIDLETGPVIDEVDLLVDEVIDTVDGAAVGVDALLQSDTSTSTQTAVSDTESDTSLQGEVGGAVGGQDATTRLQKEKDTVVKTAEDIDIHGEVTADTSARSSTSGTTTDDNIQGSADIITETESSIELGL